MTNRIYWVWAITDNLPIGSTGHKNGMYGSGPDSTIATSPGAAATAFAEDDERNEVTIIVLDPHTLERWTFSIAKTLSVTLAEVPS